jgi:hypothetical protein
LLFLATFLDSPRTSQQYTRVAANWPRTVCSKIDSNCSNDGQWRANSGECTNGLLSGQRPEQLLRAATRGCFNPLPVITSHVDLTPPNRAVCSSIYNSMSYDNGRNMQILILHAGAVVRPRRKDGHSIGLHVATVRHEQRVLRLTSLPGPPRV